MMTEQQAVDANIVFNWSFKGTFVFYKHSPEESILSASLKGKNPSRGQCSSCFPGPIQKTLVKLIMLF